MSKVITFSRVFPAYHPRRGEPTHFVEKICNGLLATYYDIDFDSIPTWPDDFCESINDQVYQYKYHTIRAGHRFKVGDKFSPRVWSGRPYNSKQIIIAPDIEVEKVWDFEIKIVDWGPGFASKIFINGVITLPEKLIEVCENDGLKLSDFLAWFQYPKSFSGQIICWNEAIEY